MMETNIKRIDIDRAYAAGAASRQAEVDVLNTRIKELELINFDATKEHIERLQKRIDEALVEIAEYYYSDGMSDLVFSDIAKILKGKENE